MAKENKKGLSEASEKEFVSRVRTVLFESDNSCYMKTVDRIMDETGETAAEIAAALIAMLTSCKASPVKNIDRTKTNQTPAKKPNAPTIKSAKKPKETAAKQKQKSAPAKMVSLSINGGLNKHFTHKDILGALSAKAGLKGADISDIKIGNSKTSFKVSSQNASKVISVMNTEDGKIKGVPVKVQIVKERKIHMRKPNKKNNLGKN